jgi:putative transposase
MARLARIVVTRLPHHVIQRGARRMQVFFCNDDYRDYLRILSAQAIGHALDVWAYCLMPNHVHLIAVPFSREGLARPLGEAHRLYAIQINRRQGWTGHLWQERFSSFPIDETRLLGALRYVLLNPVRAGLAATAADWPFSSARAHLAGAPDQLVNVRPTARLISNWKDFLDVDADSVEIEEFRRHGRIGRPLGSTAFVDEVDRITGRRLRLAKRGRKPTGK